jgi:hypothetical protein
VPQNPCPVSQELRTLTVGSRPWVLVETELITSTGEVMIARYARSGGGIVTLEEKIWMLEDALRSLHSLRDAKPITEVPE